MVAAPLGIMSGAMVHVVLAAPGIVALIAASPTLFEALRIAGAARVADRSPAAARWLDAVAGLLFLALGPRLLIPGRPA